MNEEYEFAVADFKEQVLMTTNSDKFSDMSFEAQLLFHNLVLNCTYKKCCYNVKSTTRTIGVRPQAIDELIKNGYLRQTEQDIYQVIF